MNMFGRKKAPTKTMWQYVDAKKVKEFSSETSEVLQKSYEEVEITFSIKEGRVTYVVDFSKMEMNTKSTGKSYGLLRDNVVPPVLSPESRKGAVAAPAVDSRKLRLDALHKIFDSYAALDKAEEGGTDSMSGEAIMCGNGIEAFCNDLKLDTQDVVVLVIAWMMEAAAMAEFKKTEFVKIFDKLGVDSVAGIMDQLPLLRRKFADPLEFKNIYAFLYGYCLEPGQKTMGGEMSKDMWTLIFTEKKFPLSAKWIEFVNIHFEAKKLGGVSKDCWNMLLKFLGSFDSTNLSKYEEDTEAFWPSLIDEFVLWMKPK